MINTEKQDTSHSATTQRKKKFLIFLLAVVLGLPLLGLAGLLFQLLTYREDFGWNRIYVDASEQVQTLSVGPRDVNLLVGTYEQSQEDPEFRDVDIEFTNDDQRILLLSYSYSLHPLSEPSPGIYKLKDVDGDRLKDLVVRMGSGKGNYEFYYISSQDGKAYRTDQDFQSSQLWVDSKPD